MSNEIAKALRLRQLLGGMPGEDQLSRAERRHELRAENLEEGDSLIAREPRHGYWSGSSEFGQAQSFPFDGNVGFKLDEAGFPCYWTVRIDLDYTPAIIANVPVLGIQEALAEVTMGVGGVMQTAVVNVGSGVTISGIANSITVRGLWDTEMFPYVDPQNLRMQVSVARMPSVNPMPERWIRSTAPANDVSPMMVIPKFARDISLFAMDAASLPILYGPGTILQFVADGTLTGLVDLDGLDPSLKFPIPSYSRQISIVNGSVSTNLLFKARFGIGF